ncbi:MAG TPA: family 1 glycosylhydrolase, partial [Erysipelothrix sp.]
ENLEAQEIGEAIYIKSLLDPIALGHFNPLLTKILKENDLMPVKKESDEAYLAYGIDFLGVNYYQPLRVQHQPDGKRPIQSRGDLVRGYNWPDKKVNPHRGWEIYEKGVYDIAMTLKNDYNNIPWFLSENGMGVEGEERFADENGIIQDDYRIEFIHDHLYWLNKAIQDGANCFGYHLWTFVDCWSWLNAYKNRYGFYRVDIEDNFKRTPKKSSFWMAEVIKNNKLPNK